MTLLKFWSNCIGVGLVSLVMGWSSVAWAQSCPLEQACPTQCCAATEVCYLGACEPRGATCQKDGDCQGNRFCVEKLSQCLPRTSGNNRCEYKPPIGKFSPEILWEWKGSQVQPNSRNVMMTPVVMALEDTNGDQKIDSKDVPTVIFMSFEKGFTVSDAGVIRALRGDNGKELFTIETPKVNALGSLAVGDIDNDGKPDIIAPRYTKSGDGATGIYAFDNKGKLKWTSHDKNNKPVPILISWGGPSLADLDGDGNVEVVVGSSVIRGSDGLVLCQGKKGQGTGWVMPTPTTADLDGDGKLEIVTGNTAYRSDCSVMWHNSEKDGMTGVADLNKDGRPEIVSVGAGELRVQDGLTGRVLMRAVVPGQTRSGKKGGGAPTIADMNGDGKPDIATAAFTDYLVFTPNFTTNKLDLLWKYKTQDASSGQTGSSVFDFEGDGRSEVLYNDEFFMRIFDGKTGKVIFSQKNISGTALEYPVVVDVNNDGRAEIIMCSNTNTKIPPASLPTLRVFRDKLDNWVSTRNVWNQHAYHVTNICTGDKFCPSGNRFGQIPSKRLRNWQTSGLNSFRQNVQGERSIQAASDAVPLGIQQILDRCSNELKVAFWVANKGANTLPQDLPVSVYLGDGTQKTLQKTFKTGRILGIGESVQMELTVPVNPPYPKYVTVVVDDDGQGKSTRNECNEANNALRVELTPVGCGPEPTPGEEPQEEPIVDEVIEEPDTLTEPPPIEQPQEEPIVDEIIEEIGGNDGGPELVPEKTPEPTPEPQKETSDELGVGDKITGESGPPSDEEVFVAGGCKCSSQSSPEVGWVWLLFVIFWGGWGLHFRRKAK